MTTSWKTLAGNYDYIDPASFQSSYEAYSKKKNVNKENVDEVPGFVDRDASLQIKLRRPGTSAQSGKSQPVTAATIEAAVHETIHINSQESFQNDFTHAVNEGVTEYFAEMAMGTSGGAYREQLELAKGLRDALGPGGERLPHGDRRTNVRDVRPGPVGIGIPGFESAAVGVGHLRGDGVLVGGPVLLRADRRLAQPLHPADGLPAAGGPRASAHLARGAAHPAAAVSAGRGHAMERHQCHAEHPRRDAGRLHADEKHPVEASVSRHKCSIANVVIAGHALVVAGAGE